MIRIESAEKSDSAAVSSLMQEPLFLLADGSLSDAGAADAGRITCEIIRKSFFAYLSCNNSVENSLRRALNDANRHFLSQRARSSQRMAAALCALVLDGGDAHVACVGDCRAVLVSGQKNRSIAPEPPAPARGAARPLTEQPPSRALGKDDDPQIQIRRQALPPAGTLILATAGLAAGLPEQELGGIFARQENLQDLCARAFDEAGSRAADTGKGLVAVRYERPVEPGGGKPLLIGLAAILAAGLLYAGLRAVANLKPPERLSAARPPASAPQTPTGKVRPDEAEIRVLLTTWETAWEQRDVERYAGCYAATFTSQQGQGKERWRAAREQVIREKAWIRIDVSELAIARPARDRAVATFLLEYRSPGYGEQARKTLTLTYSDGHWLIGKEETRTIRKTAPPTAPPSAPSPGDQSARPETRQLPAETTAPETRTPIP